MEQLQQVGEFIWKWRFWFSVGLAAILAMLINFFGVPNVKQQVTQRTNQLEGIFNQINRFATGVHPNRTWTSKVDEDTKQLEQLLGLTPETPAAGQNAASVYDQIYDQQAKRLTWPAEVARFNDRPFNSPLNEERGTYLFLYYKAFDKQFEELRKIVQPISEDQNGYAQGKVRLRDGALDRPKWTRAPTDTEAWLAQEQIWIQRAILESIAKVNENARDWRDAPIREIVRIAIGQEGVDIKRAAEQGGDAKLNELPPAGGFAGQPGSPSGGGRQDDSSGLNPARYLEPVGGNFRTIPVLIRILGDQSKLPEILAGLGATDFLFVEKECNWSVPASKVEVPRYEDVTPGSTREIVDTTLEIVLKGDVRIYEMPPARRQAWQQAQMPATPGAPPPGTSPGAPALPAPGQPTLAPGSPGAPPAGVPPTGAGPAPVTGAPPTGVLPAAVPSVSAPM